MASFEVSAARYRPLLADTRNAPRLFADWFFLRRGNNPAHELNNIYFLTYAFSHKHKNTHTDVYQIPLYFFDLFCVFWAF